MREGDRPGTRGNLKLLGFEGFLPMGAVATDDLPAAPGVYAVICNGFPVPVRRSVGGWFKGKDPTQDVGALTRRLVPGADVLYFGRAEQNSPGRGLRKRVDELLRFGRGQAVGHWGGRYLWQLSNPFANLIAWLPVEAADVKATELRLLEEFRDEHGVLPFANLRL